jgi:hypothetical protein
LAFQFIAGGGFDEEDITLMPVKLPIEIKTDPSIKKDDYTKVKVKSEPMDTDEANDSMRDEGQKTSKDEMWKGKTEERQITCSELFTNPLKSGTSNVYNLILKLPLLFYKFYFIFLMVFQYMYYITKFYL